MIAEGLISACHDVSDGGLLVALAEMAIAAKRGLTVEPLDHDVPAHAFWFGEDQARYVVTIRAADRDRLVTHAAGAGVTLTRLGATGGDSLTVPGEEPILVKDLSETFEVVAAGLYGARGLNFGDDLCRWRPPISSG